MPPLTTAPRPDRGKAFWRSLDELADNQEFRKFVESEFPAWADEMLTPTRRNFLKIMGASLALAGMTGCRWPTEEILPFTQRPDGYTPGTALRYATSMELGGVGAGLLVTSVDGRPVKIEGNPMHPASLGATSAIAQASVLDLYDPDRSRNIVRFEGGNATVTSRDDFARIAGEHFATLRRNAGRGFRILSETSASPSVQAMKDRLLVAFPEARWYEYESVSRDNELEGTRLVFGRPHRPQPAFDRAGVIVSLDDDFLVNHPDAVRFASEFIQARSADREEINRLYVVESQYSNTGSMADHRFPVMSSAIPTVAGCLAARLVAEHGLRLPEQARGLRSVVESFRSHRFYNRIAPAMAEDLMAARGRSLVLAGARQPAEVHALVHVLNAALGNVGTTLSYTEEQDRPSHVEAIAQLAGEMNGGAVETLLILGGNPAYDAPGDLEFENLMSRVDTTIHLGLYRDETAHASKWHVPRAHYLESWGDTRDWQGNTALVQPLIEPLFGGQSTVELLAQVLGDGPTKGHDIVRRTFSESRPGDAAWRRALHDGRIENSAWSTGQPAPRAGDWAGRLAAALDVAELSGNDVELIFVQDSRLYDGRFANNGWLQELPDSLTKLTWDNAALVGPSTAQRLGVKQGDLMRVEAEGREIELPVYVMPGQAAGSIAVSLGFGRRISGRVGDGVGRSLQPLRTTKAMHATRVRASRSGGGYLLATTQNHYALEPLGAAEMDVRTGMLAREMDFEEYKHGHAHDDHGVHEAPLWKQWEYDGYKWGMAIDLNACTGCNACLVACQAENNIPVVGKQEVANGREMHWIRVDRYFRGDPEDPGVVHQPLTCHHCENAPCEQVCPVAATVHDSEGLNVMVYNRCVGTRYCMNNCPYKVRRFNYFNNHKNESAVETMVFNPEVTVRARGVMEKCTFCVQRISKARIQAKNDGRRIEDTEITTACAEACPTRAISFGDLNDTASEVRAKHHDPRAYAILDLLAVKPRTRYLTRLVNRNPSIRTDDHETGEA